MNRNTFLLAIGLVLAACLTVGGFAALKNYRDKVSPAPVVEKKNNSQPAKEKQPPEEKVEEEAPPEDNPVVEKPKKSKKANVTEDFGRMNPMMGELPTKEEAIEEAWNVLNAYREASPEEKQQIASQLVMAQSVMNGFAQNAGVLLQQMPPEMRDEIINTASASIDLIAAVRDEMAGAVTPEEAMVFGGVFQSLQNLCESFSYEPAPF